MPRRIMLSYQVFWAGLGLVLLAGVSSTTVFKADGIVLPLLTLAGGIAAVAARLWQRRLRRAAHSASIGGGTMLA